MNHSTDKVFDPQPVAEPEAALISAFLTNNDFSLNTRRAFRQDLRKFTNWFTVANKEPFKIGRVTTRDVSDFRDSLRRDKGQATATVNRALVTVRGFFSWLVDEGQL